MSVAFRVIRGADLRARNTFGVAARAPLLVELELTEPSLFLGTARGAPERFAGALASCVGIRSSRPPAPH